MAVASLIIDIFSLIATIFVSFLLYWLEKKKEKEIEKQEQKKSDEKIEIEAINFIRNNNKELGYLPLCAFANNLNKLKPHDRNIYNNFFTCSSTLQEKILEMQGYKFTFKTRTWLSDCYNKLVADALKYDLGENIKYDTEQYLFKCFSRYKDLKRYEFNPCICPIINENSIFFSIYGEHHLIDIHSYIEDYLNLTERENIEKPIDFIYKRFINGNEKIFCYWFLHLVYSLADIISERYYDSRNPDDRYFFMSNDTFEDFFYRTAWLLYEIYSK